MSESVPDRWAEWVLTTRYGTDEAHHRRVLDYLRPIRDRVLQNASISAGDTLVDIGTGDGLIAFGAVPLVGPEGKVILSDVSPTVSRDGEEDALSRTPRRLARVTNATEPMATSVS